MIFYYAISYAEEMTRDDLDEIKKEVKSLLGEREMSTVLDQLQAEGWAEGEVKREVKLILKILVRLGTVPDALAERIRSITDIDELDHLTDVALDSRSLDEFVKHLS